MNLMAQRSGIFTIYHNIKRCKFEKLQKTDDDVRELIQMLQELEMF